MVVEVRLPPPRGVGSLAIICGSRSSLGHSCMGRPVGPCQLLWATGVEAIGYGSHLAAGGADDDGQVVVVVVAPSNEAVSTRVRHVDSCCAFW
jgi:hypothetical protein